MTHPIYADDAVGRICGELSVWALDFATQVLIASKKTRTKAERVAALRLAFELYPKITRRMAELEGVAQASSDAGYEADAQMQDMLEVIRRADRSAALVLGDQREGEG